MKKTEIYMRNKHYYIAPMSMTTVGLFIGAEPITVMEDNVSDEALGKNIMDAFEFSNENVPHPDTKDWLQVLKPLLRAAKVRYWKTFVEGAELISLENVNETIKLVPCVNCGAKIGFTYAKEKLCILPIDCPTVELGKIVKNLFRDIVGMQMKKIETMKNCKEKFILELYKPILYPYYK